MAVQFHLEKYDGPLDLLLALIQKSELNIYDIPIAQITDQFLDYLHQAEEVGLEDLSEFYVEAANLIWIKSQIMLPVEVDFGEDYVDPREELVERLLEYSKYKKYSELLMGNEDAEDIRIERKSSDFVLPCTDEDLFDSVTLKILRETYLQMMDIYSRLDEEIPINIFEMVTEGEKITLMNELLEDRDQIMFSDLIKKGKTDGHMKLHIICAFLAVLEAIKDKIILVQQSEVFGDMILTKRPIDWNPNLADEYDKNYDEIVQNHLEDESSYSIEEGI